MAADGKEVCVLSEPCRVAAWCSTLHCIIACCSQEAGPRSGKIRGCVLLHVAVCWRTCASVVECVAVCVIVWCSVLQCVVVWCREVQCSQQVHKNVLRMRRFLEWWRFSYLNALQQTATHCNPLHCNAVVPSTTATLVSQRTATHCTTCNTLQHTATHCKTLRHSCL